MFEKLDDKWYRGVFLDFKDDGRVALGSKTRKFSVYDRKSGTFIGYVKWLAPWRQYTFFGTNPVLMSKMLIELGTFASFVTQQHKQKSK